MSFTVTRQSQYLTGDQIVEVSQGSIDYANADMLVEKYRKLGEGDTFQEMTLAIGAAVAIAKAWQADEPKQKILIGLGNTHGMSLPFEGHKPTKKHIKELLKQAEEHDEKLPRCACCGAILGEGRGDRYGNEFTVHFETGDGQYPFCSSYCAEKDQAFQERENAEFAGESSDTD